MAECDDHFVEAQLKIVAFISAQSFASIHGRISDWASDFAVRSSIFGLMNSSSPCPTSGSLSMDDVPLVAPAACATQVIISSLRLRAGTCFDMPGVVVARPMIFRLHRAAQL